MIRSQWPRFDLVDRPRDNDPNFTVVVNPSAVIAVVENDGFDLIVTAASNFKVESGAADRLDPYGNPIHTRHPSNK